MQTLQVGANFRGVLIAVLGVFLETQVDDPGQGGGNIGIELSWRDRDLLNDGDQKLARGISPERRAAGAHLVNRDAEREEIGARVDLSTQRLLGRHVCGRSHCGAKAVSELLSLQGRLLPGGCEFLYGHHFGQAEVQDLGTAAFGNEDVCWLDVAVDDALLMRRFEGVRDVDRDFDHAIDGKRAFLNQLFQRFAIQELHGDEGAAAFFGDLMNGADVGMVQGRSGTRLAPETFQNRTDRWRSDRAGI